MNVPTEYVFIQTRSGMKFQTLDPLPSSLRIEDIAYALSNVARFGGHAKRGACGCPYTVAEHAVRVSERAESLAEPTRKARVALAGLLHDCAEAYIGDIAKPHRMTPMGAGYRDLEDRILLAAEERWWLEGCLVDKPVEVAQADREMMSTERRDLMVVVPWEWEDLPPPLPEIIEPWTHEQAERRFMERYRQLTERRPTCRL